MTGNERIFETRLTHSLFSDILELVSYDSRVWNKELELSVYLPRLRHGYTFDELANRWSIKRHTTSIYCQNIRRHLSEKFGVLHLPSLSDREVLVSH